MKSVEIYTDGACSYNPGPGGWCAILLYKKGENCHEKCVSGGEAVTTNNRMELTAVIEGLKQLKTRCKVALYSDSAYVVNAFNENWIGKWKINGWKKSVNSKEDIKNRDLWEALYKEVSAHEVEFVKVKGHSDVDYNNRCDEVARSEILKFAPLDPKINEGRGFEVDSETDPD